MSLGFILICFSIILPAAIGAGAPVKEENVNGLEQAITPDMTAGSAVGVLPGDEKSEEDAKNCFGFPHRRGRGRGGNYPGGGGTIPGGNIPGGNLPGGGNIPGGNLPGGGDIPGTNDLPETPAGELPDAEDIPTEAEDVRRKRKRRRRKKLGSHIVKLLHR